MGSWNETCMLSNLPIMEGDDVKCVLIFDRGNGVSVPTLLPLEGKYDDYGNFKPNKSEEELVEFLNVTTVNDMGGIVIDTVFNNWEGAKLKTEDFNGILTTAFFHSDMWNVAINGLSEMKYGYSATARNYRDEFEHQMTHNPMSELLQASKRSLTEDQKSALEEMEKSHFTSIALGFRSDWIYPIEYDVKFKDRYIDMKLMISFVDRTRRVWHDNAHGGSQSTHYKLHKHFNDFVCKFTDDRKRKHEEMMR